MKPTCRVMLSFRVNTDGVALLEKQAARAGVSRSEWARMALGLALAEPERVAIALRRSVQSQ